MTEHTSLKNKRLLYAIEQTLALLSKSGADLIKVVAKSLVFKIKPYDVREFKGPAIYRAIRTFNEKKESVIFLSGLYSPLFGREVNSEQDQPFSLIVNMDEDSLKEGFIWFSPERRKAYKLSEVDLLVLDNDRFIPYDFMSKKKEEA